MSQKRLFKGFDRSGKEIDLAVIKPSVKVQQDAQLAHNSEFAKAAGSKALLRAAVEGIMREQKLWDDTKEDAVNKLGETIRANELKLKAGGIKLNAARKLALEMADARRDRNALLAGRNRLDVNTVEGQAEQARFNFLVSACTVDAKTGKPYFSSYEDYLGRDDDAMVLLAGREFGVLYYDYDPDYQSKLPENVFLKKYKFIDDKMRFINVDGHLTDRDGRLINENGNYVNAAGELIDIDGNRVDDKGEFLVEEKPFLDDEGTPVVPVEPVAPVSETPLPV